MNLRDALLQLESQAREAAPSFRDAAAALAGMESQFETSLNFLAVPRTQAELQGCLELTLMTVRVVRSLAERQAVAFADVENRVREGRELLETLTAAADDL